MKNILTLILFTLVTIPSISQNLSLKQLITVRKKNMAEAEEYLTLRNWSFISAESATTDKYGGLSFAYNKSKFNDNAESFIWLYFSDSENYPNRLSIQIHKKEKYNEYITQIKKWGGKIYDSYIEDDVFFKVYQGSTITYIISTSTQKDDFSSSSTIYSFFILENDDFKHTKHNRKESKQ
ncbi:hypothetical protein [Tenacibaculum amylolyticum]|uniref:hypothetical protein n=1 Tax=Tenacibaculum amylolyticum TaxID=104269 RepID=UPI003896626F